MEKNLNEGFLHMICKGYADRATKFDLNAMVAITGEMGTGKSSLALRMAEILSDEYGLKFKGVRDIYFDLEDLKAELVSAKHRVMIVDEAGVQLYSRDFAKEANKEIVKIAQMLRFRNSVIIWTLPHFGFLDKGVRLLIHHVWRTEKHFMKNPETKNIELIRVAKPYVVVTDFINPKSLRIEPASVKIRGQYIEVPWMRWKMPRKKLWEEYQKKKEQFWKDKLGEGARKYKNAGEAIKAWLNEHPDDAKVLLDPKYKGTRKRGDVVRRIAKSLGYSEKTIYQTMLEYALPK